MQAEGVQAGLGVQAEGVQAEGQGHRPKGFRLKCSEFLPSA